MICGGVAWVASLFVPCPFGTRSSAVCRPTLRQLFSSSVAMPGRPSLDAQASAASDAMGISFLTQESFDRLDELASVLPTEWVAKTRTLHSVRPRRALTADPIHSLGPSSLAWNMRRFHSATPFTLSILTRLMQPSGKGSAADHESSVEKLFCKCYWFEQIDHAQRCLYQHWSVDTIFNNIRYSAHQQRKAKEEHSAVRPI